MKKIYKQSNRNYKSNRIVDVQLEKFNKRARNSKRFCVTLSGNSLYQVQIPDTGYKYIVNSKERECDCTYFFDYQSPCTHAIAACRYAVEDPYKYFIIQYTILSYQNTYKHFLVPFSINNLPSDLDILPPVYKKQRGWPKTKRFRKGHWKRKDTHCSSCHGIDHNIRTCRSVPAINSQQQHARDRAMSLDLSMDLSLGSSSDDESVDTIDLQFQAEMEQYDEIQARTHEIVDRRRQEEQEDNNLIDSDGGSDSDIESDSDLSMLASSLFDSIEGIEMGGGIELSNGGDVQRNVQGILSSDSKVQGSIISPRKD
jgi:hypothetical protein